MLFKGMEIWITMKNLSNGCLLIPIPLSVCCFEEMVFIFRNVLSSSLLHPFLRTARHELQQAQAMQAASEFLPNTALDFCLAASSFRYAFVLSVRIVLAFRLAGCDLQIQIMFRITKVQVLRAFVSLLPSY